MRKIAVIIAAVAALSAGTVQGAEQATAQAHQKMKQLMADPALKKQLMGNPHHTLAMFYVHSLKSFAQGLKMAAKQQETVAPEVLKTAVEEMKRDLDQAEKHHKEMLASLPEETRNKVSEMAKMMEEHAANARTHLGHLEQLAGKEKIESKEVLKHLDLMMAGCDKMDMMHGHGMSKKKQQQKKQ
ncbi:MAG TPA: hypothetical protein VNX25_06870 [Verrucomicrobiae bacterium]|nr:hypothetical protein [Verrucomicrobiae bacterium]